MWQEPEDGGLEAWLTALGGESNSLAEAQWHLSQPASQHTPDLLAAGSEAMTQPWCTPMEGVQQQQLQHPQRQPQQTSSPQPTASSMMASEPQQQGSQLLSYALQAVPGTRPAHQQQLMPDDAYRHLATPAAVDQRTYLSQQLQEFPGQLSPSAAAFPGLQQQPGSLSDQIAATPPLPQQPPSQAAQQLGSPTGAAASQRQRPGSGVAKQTANPAAGAAVASGGQQPRAAAAARGGGSRKQQQQRSPEAEEAEADPQVAKLLRRQRMLQDKNRRAQARFRERQKGKMEGFQNTISELSGRVAELEMRKAELAQRNETLQKAVSLRQDGRAASGNAPLDEEEAAVQQLVDYLNLVQPDGGHPRVDAAAVRRMGIPDFVARYRDMVQEVAALLLAGGEDLNCPAGVRLAAIVATSQQIALSLCTKRPKAMRALEAGILNDPLQRHGPPTAEHWRRVMASMRLSGEQQAGMLQARHTLLQRMTQLMAQRRQIIGHLTIAMPSATDDRGNTVGFVKASHASGKLRQNLQAEGQAVSTFLTAWHRQIVTPVQEARSLVEAYPWVPDPMAMCETLATDINGSKQEEEEFGGGAAAWMGGLHGGSGAGLLPPGSAFRLLSTFQGASPASTPPPQLRQPPASLA